MAVDKPVQAGSENTEERPAIKKGVYPVRLLGAEEVENRFYHAEPWTDKDGTEKPADHPDNKTQMRVKFEMLDDKNNGRWATYFCGHYFGMDKDGEPKGKRANLVAALKPDAWRDGAERDYSDLTGMVCNATIENRKGSDGKNYPKITDFMPMDAADIIKYTVGGTVTEDTKSDPFVGDETIPF